MTTTGSDNAPRLLGTVPSLIDGEEVPLGFWGNDAVTLGDKLRERTPAVRVRVPNGFFATSLLRYHHVEEMLKNPGKRFSQDYELVSRVLGDRLEEVGQPWETMALVQKRVVLFSEAPDHMRRRKPFIPWFRANAVPEPAIMRVTDRLIADMPPPGVSFDLVEALALPLPLEIICDMLGVPDADRAELLRFTTAMMDDNQATALPASGDVVGYFAKLVRDKQRAPGGDILSELLGASAEGQRLSDEEILANAVLLVVAGHETTVGLITNAVVAALQHGVWDQVVADPDLVPALVRETLRACAPLHNAGWRVALCDIDLGERVVIPEGELVLGNLVAANRDPRVFTNPHVFDLHRDEQPNLAFGYGPHVCLGRFLAVTEAVIALRALVAKAPNLTLDPASELQWRLSLIPNRPVRAMVSY